MSQSYKCQLTLSNNLDLPLKRVTNRERNFMKIKPKLISFDLCPFVQRSVITLLEKEVEFDVEYIDLENKPDWFLEISPFGKVPLLQVGDVVLFESAIINEYLDEIYGPSIHPSDPLIKAQNRAWIEFGNHLLFLEYGAVMAKTKDEFDKKRTVLRNEIAKLEAVLSKGYYFNGDEFGLIDAAYAPLFQRFVLIEDMTKTGILEDFPKIKNWIHHLVKRQSVMNSVPEGFDHSYITYIKNKETYLSDIIS